MATEVTAVMAVAVTAATAVAARGPPTFAAAAAAAAKGWVWVEYFDLLATDEADSPLLREWVAAGAVRVAPPPVPAGFHSLLRPGDSVQLLVEEAFWVRLPQLPQLPQLPHLPEGFHSPLDETRRRLPPRHPPAPVHATPPPRGPGMPLPNSLCAG